MGEMFSTREVAKFLNVNEKMVYSLIAEKGLPASKVTGKWIFPIHLVRQWIEAGTENYPQLAKLPPYHGLVLIAGSNDLLLDKIISTFNLKHEKHMAMFGISGSMGGLRALRQNLCHIAASHLVADNEEYNFPFLKDEMNQIPAVVNFSLREQGILIQKGNPKNILSVKDLGRKGVKIINRQLGTGTRQLFDKMLKKADLTGETIDGYENCFPKHMDVGLQILTKKADAGPGIRPVANILGLDFIPICWERFDLLINKDRFFDQGIQLFLSLLKGKVIQTTAEEYGGYDLSMTGKMIYPEPEPESE
ncbi:MAG: helix-turn-helix transcriptional regulator [Proteobacteria bacterium]|nr:helix-turn-helix transcriptional regulator [Pseudomonadota bacterium]MBU1584084.1 helix-turn-helix transcriptional regulator [Pseudomonadota bacterium]MBU2455817.1 helix-turn-helix transcriptional regulator [Pseudomonadota bacterium]MBU2627873.1 helix-turn-helix transcriptional regulator [Pseudomonadota bacterium]